MKLVQERFLNALNEELHAAISLTYVVDLGKNKFESHPETSRGTYRHGFISINEPELGMFANSSVDVVDAYEFVKTNSTLVFEVFHNLMIQSWFQFLSGLHREMIYSLRHAERKYDIDKKKISISLELLSKKHLPDVIFHDICDDFERENADKKISIVLKGLGKNSATLEPELSIIRQEIIVRNLIQHNKGVIRDEDIEKNGKSFTKVDMTAGRIEKLSAGQRIQRDLSDIRKLAAVFYSISEKLLGDEDPVHMIAKTTDK